MQCIVIDRPVSGRLENMLRYTWRCDARLEPQTDGSSAANDLAISAAPSLTILQQMSCCVDEMAILTSTAGPPWLTQWNTLGHFAFGAIVFLRPQ